MTGRFVPDLQDSSSFKWQNQTRPQVYLDAIRVVLIVLVVSNIQRIFNPALVMLGLGGPLKEVVDLVPSIEIFVTQYHFDNFCLAHLSHETKFVAKQLDDD